MSDQPGFEIHGQFYPWIPFDDWKLADPRLVRALTGYDERELLTGAVSPRIVNAAFAAVAFRRAQPAATETEVVKFFEGLSPDSDIKCIGFPTVQPGTDAGPPEASGSEPSSSSEPSPEPTQETSIPSGDGDQPSETGSDSAPPTSSS